MKPLTGVIPIVLTPFESDGTLAHQQFDRELAFLGERQVEWVGFGFGSEVPKLSPEELSELIGRSVRSGLDVVGNAEVTSASAGIAAIHRVAEAGARVAMVRPTGMVGLPESAVVETIADVADHAPVPIVVQDAPQNTGTVLSPDSLAELSRHPRVAALKIEPPASAPKVSAIHSALFMGDPALFERNIAGSPMINTREGVAVNAGVGVVLGGLGGQDVLHELQRGARGTMPGPAFPEIFQAVLRRHAQGDDAGASHILARILPLINLGQRDGESFLVVQKHILTRRGVLNGHHLRGPHAAIDPKLVAETDALIENTGLLELIDECVRE